ncbi:unnamed protein product [Cyprideis torosa]|uniref:Uncharacterized protein n=1 Tax=Cyprideis torosa TaxID=163714 RepID=A0A7R8ZKW1_9CRUS|nr:unnamed protein product [Cyprideis torosa]CAG0885239.1 unnamed protein product [Cyprideis torosa]
MARVASKRQEKRRDDASACAVQIGHRRFSSGLRSFTAQNDYAVLRVNPPFQFSSFIQPISLGYGSATWLTTCYNSGWGRFSQDPNNLSGTTELKYIKVDVRSDFECMFYRLFYDFNAQTCTWTPGFNVCNMELQKILL